jgi:hypothetical protein
MNCVAKKLCRAGALVALAVAAVALPGAAQAAPPVLNGHFEVPESRTLTIADLPFSRKKSPGSMS